MPPRCRRHDPRRAIILGHNPALLRQGPPAPRSCRDHLQPRDGRHRRMLSHTPMSRTLSPLSQGGPPRTNMRQVMVDTDGRGLILEPQPADVQDRDGAVAVLRLSRRAFPFVAKAFADAGYAGDKPATATIITVEIVRKPPDQIGFAVHPRRWVVE